MTPKMKQGKMLHRALALALIGAMAAACGSDNGPSEQPPPNEISVDVQNNFFESERNATQNPAVDTLAAGGTVTWTWVSEGEHSIRSTNTPNFDSSPTHRAPGSEYSATFAEPGTYSYDCSVHGSPMAGQIVVR